MVPSDEVEISPHKFIMQEWGFYLEGVWPVAPSEEASRQKCDKLLYVSMGGALVRVSPQSLHLDQGLSFRDEALFEGNVGPNNHLRCISSNTVS